MNVVLLCRPQGLPRQDSPHPTPSCDWPLQLNNQRLVNHHNASQKHSKERKMLDLQSMLPYSGIHLSGQTPIV